MYKKIVYICSPLKGDIENNIKKAEEYSKLAKNLGYIPYAPHIQFRSFIDDNIKEDREIAMKMGLRMLEKCDELWIFGKKISEGMTSEILKAYKLRIPVYHKNTSILNKRIRQKFAA